MSRMDTPAARALFRLEDRAQRYETALIEVVDAVTLKDARDIARRAIREAHYGPLDFEAGTPSEDTG